MENKTKVVVNGRAIALNPFVQRVISGVVLGAVGSLDRLPRPMKKVEVIVQVEDEQGGQRQKP
jgi:hypothetical protein